MQLEPQHCTVCGPTAPKKVKYRSTLPNELTIDPDFFSARRTPEKLHFQFVECLDCHLIFSDPYPSELFLSDAYSESEIRYDAIEKYILESYRPLLDRALKVMSGRDLFVEIGGGSGFLLEYAREHGFQRCVEIEPTKAGESRFQSSATNVDFIRETFGPGVLERESTDLICFFQTLDHVPDPHCFLSEIYNALKPRGIAVAVMHDTHAITTRLLGERSPIFHACHKYLFNQKNLARLCQSVGFSPVETFSIANTYPLSYWASLIPFPKKIGSAISKALQRTGLSNKALKLHAGNLALLARKPSAND